MGRTQRLREAIHTYLGETGEANTTMILDHINSRFRWIVSDGRELFLVLNQGLRELGGDVETGRTEALAKIAWIFRF